jgi:hypothetical protein
MANATWTVGGLAAFLALGLSTPVWAHDGPAGHTHAVAAAVANRVSVTTRDGYRFIECNGIPDHRTGAFPNRGNPNTIEPQQYSFRMPLKPKEADRPQEGRFLIGVALNGVVFDPGTAEFWQNDRRSGWNYDALSGKINLGLDQNNAHVQPSGAYHYHGLPTGLMQSLGGDKDRMLLIGYAADGFPMYSSRAHKDASDAASALVEMKSSYRLKSGVRPDGPGGKYDGTYTRDFEYVPGAGDLDECNGRRGVTRESPEGTYYYALTADYPFIPRMLKGEPDASFERMGPPPGGPGGRGGPRGPGGPPPGGRGGPPPRRSFE